MPGYLWLLLGVALGTAVTSWVFLGPLPFPDRGSRIFACTSLRARNILAEVLSQNGLKPRFVINSHGKGGGLLVGRMLMSDGSTILNWTDAQLHSAMGSPAAGIAVVCKNPLTAAKEARRRLANAGFTARIKEDPDPSLNEGAMVFLMTDALEGAILVFRRHVIKLGGDSPKRVKRS